jgi:hypothetical protein
MQTGTPNIVLKTGRTRDNISQRRGARQKLLLQAWKDSAKPFIYTLLTEFFKLI